MRGCEGPRGGGRWKFRRRDYQTKTGEGSEWVEECPKLGRLELLRPVAIALCASWVSGLKVKRTTMTSTEEVDK